MTASSLRRMVSWVKRALSAPKTSPNMVTIWPNKQMMSVDHQNARTSRYNEAFESEGLPPFTKIQQYFLDGDVSMSTHLNTGHAWCAMIAKPTPMAVDLNAPYAFLVGFGLSNEARAWTNLNGSLWLNFISLIHIFLLSPARGHSISKLELVTPHSVLVLVVSSSSNANSIELHPGNEPSTSNSTPKTNSRNLRYSWSKTSSAVFYIWTISTIKRPRQEADCTSGCFVSPLYNAYHHHKR